MTQPPPPESEFLLYTAPDGGIKKDSTTIRKFLIVQKNKAEKEYSKFRVEQDRTFESDFDREVKKVLKKGGKE